MTSEEIQADLVSVFEAALPDGVTLAECGREMLLEHYAGEIEFLARCPVILSRADAGLRKKIGMVARCSGALAHAFKYDAVRFEHVMAGVSAANTLDPTNLCG